MMVASSSGDPRPGTERLHDALRVLGFHRASERAQLHLLTELFIYAGIAEDAALLAACDHALEQLVVGAPDVGGPCRYDS